MDQDVDGAVDQVHGSGARGPRERGVHEQGLAGGDALLDAEARDEAAELGAAAQGGARDQPLQHVGAGQIEEAEIDPAALDRHAELAIERGGQARERAAGAVQLRLQVEAARDRDVGLELRQDVAEAQVVRRGAERDVRRVSPGVEAGAELGLAFGQIEAVGSDAQEAILQGEVEAGPVDRQSRSFELIDPEAQAQIQRLEGAERCGLGARRGRRALVGASGCCSHGPFGRMPKSAR